MNVSVASENSAPTDLLVVFATQDTQTVLTAEAQAVDAVVKGALTRIVAEDGFTAEQGKTVLVHGEDAAPAKRILIVGLGKVADLTVADLQSVAAVIGRSAASVKAKSVSIVIPAELVKTFTAEKAGESLVVGVTLGAYTFLKHKNKEEQAKNTPVDTLTLIAPSTPSGFATSPLEPGARHGEIVAQAVAFTRDLVNEPSSVTTPTYLATVAESIAKDSGGAITAEILSRPDMQKLGMGGLLGIAQGSDEEPKFIKLEYKGTGKTIALVGKGITFDTGGLSIKSSEGMETMKLDMAGSAAVLGVFSALAKVKPSMHVVGLISATENMPSGKAIKPGDVVTAMNGKTIEILNTDAEGRVVLADALSYAVAKVKPDMIIDLATLTGACMIALGEEIAGVFANNAELATSVKNAAAATGERLWELPLAREYKHLIKSPVADIKNISGTRYGGATSGALFLQEFVPDSIPWAHIDMAGPAFAEKDKPLTPRGGTGFGVAMLLELLKDK